MKDETAEKFEEFLKENRSSKCWDKYIKLSKQKSKLHKKDNDFTKYRDKIVLSLMELKSVLNYIPYILTTESGREDLRKMEKEIVELFQNYDLLEEKK